MRQPRPIAGAKAHHPLTIVREAAGLTLQQVARRMRTNVPTLSRLEGGQLLVGDAYLARYAKALGVRHRQARLAYWLGVQLYALRLLEQAHSEIQRRYPVSR